MEKRGARALSRVARFRWQPLAAAQSELYKQKLDEVEAERFEEAATRLDALQQELEASWPIGTAQADKGSRRLLTSEAGDAEEAVAEALEALGFKVERVDSTLLTDEAKVEDLRVTDSDDPEWLALAEVRSYRGGAKLADLMKLSRFGMLHAATHGAPPSRTWYIVNQFRGTRPQHPGCQYSIRTPMRSRCSQRSAALSSKRASSSIWSSAR